VPTISVTQPHPPHCTDGRVIVDTASGHSTASFNSPDTCIWLEAAVGKRL